MVPFSFCPVRLSSSPEADSDAPLWRNHIQPEELLQTMESSTSTDSSLIEGKPAGLLMKEISSEITFLLQLNISKTQQLTLLFVPHFHRLCRFPPTE